MRFVTHMITRKLSHWNFHHLNIWSFVSLVYLPIILLNMKKYYIEKRFWHNIYPSIILFCWCLEAFISAACLLIMVVIKTKILRAMKYTALMDLKCLSFRLTVVIMLLIVFHKLRQYTFSTHAPNIARKSPQAWICSWMKHE